PRLDSLPEQDRPIVARALSKDPARRFPSCTEFVRALLSARAPTAKGAGAPQAQTPLPGTDRTIHDHAAPANGSVEADHSTSGPGRENSAAQPKLSPANRAALRGYEFLTSLATSPLAEVWKVRDPDGRERIVKFLYGV